MAALLGRIFFSNWSGYIIPKAKQQPIATKLIPKRGKESEWPRKLQGGSKASPSSGELSAHSAQIANERESHRTPRKKPKACKTEKKEEE